MSLPSRPARASRALLPLLCGLSLLALAPAADAAVRTAGPGGIAAALRASAPGDIVQLRAGTYRDAVTVPAFAGDVTVEPAPGASPTLTSLTFTGGSHLVLRNLVLRSLRVTGTTDLTVSGGQVVTGGAFFSATHRLTVSGVKVHDANDGLVVQKANDFTISRNECFNVPLPTRKEGGDCLQMVTTNRFKITDNAFHDQPSKPHTDAIEILDNNADGLIARNTFRNVRGIVLTPGNYPLRDQWRIRVENNLFARTRTFAFNGIRMHDSVFRNNTAVDGGYVQFGGASSGNTVVNNIMSRFQVDVTRQRTYIPVEDYNLIASAPAGTKFGAHDLIGTATFRNAAAGDYRLASGSKGIGAGTTSNLPADDLTGALRTTPDLGAYRFTP
jgi:hypothetical protein